MKKTVLITGCSSGIGRELAIALQQLGCQVIATARNLDSIQGLSEQGCLLQQLDVTDADSIQLAIARAQRDCQGVDILINNAGYGAYGRLVDLPLDDVRQQLETNTVAPLALIQAVVPGMREKGGGRIVNISSVLSEFGLPLTGAYSASKAALCRLSDALRIELASDHIDVISVRPGRVKTPFFAKVSQRMTPEAVAQLTTKVAKTTPKRFAAIIAPRLLAQNPKPVLRYGDGSLIFPLLLTLLPLRWVDRFISQAFELPKTT